MEYNMHRMLFTILALAGSLLAGGVYGAEEHKSMVGHSITLEARQKGTVFLVNGRAFEDLTSMIWSVETVSGVVSSSDSAEIEIKTTPDKASVLSGKAGNIAWTARCESIAPDTVTVTVRLVPDKRLTIHRVHLFNAKSALSPIIARTGLQDICAFYRSTYAGIFVSLDYPYSKITEKNGVTSISYPPDVIVDASKEYICHSYTVGATHLTGKQRYGYYEGEVDAMDSYVQNRFKSKFDRPITSTASIVNRYTQLEGNWIFYTMKDHPTLTFNRDILKRELKLMGDMDIEFFQVFPGVFDWGPNDPSDKQVREAMDWARKNHVRMGDYSGCNSVFCPHYAQYQNTLAGTPAEGQQCFGSRKFVDWYSNKVVTNARKFGFDTHIMDFLSIGVCNDPNHGHPVGEDSIYHQIKGLVDVMDRISAVSPEMLIWPNSGCWTDLLPKIAWHAPSQYLTDPVIGTPWQGLNMTRLLDDARREQMVNIHYSHFIPYRYFTNCQYFFVQNSITPDIRNFEYGALSTMAVTPNICVAEVRPWVDSLSETDKKQVLAFYTKWNRFMRDNFELWKHTYHLGDEPAPGSLEVYSHAKSDHGFVFVVNPNYTSRAVEVPLDSSLGFSGNEECEISELYPCERLRLTPDGPYIKLGTKLAIDIPAQTVLVLEVKPRPQSIEFPRLYGIPGKIKKNKNGYVLNTTGPQGTAERFAVLLPGGVKPITSIDVEKSVPQLDRRQWNWDPTALNLLTANKSGVLADLTFRRKAASKDLSKWSVRPGNLEDGTCANWAVNIPEAKEVVFPVAADAPVTGPKLNESGYGPLANFCGGYLENGFSEDQETVIYLKTKDDTALSDTGQESFKGEAPDMSNREPNPIINDKSKSWWLQTKFDTPLAQWGGCEAGLNDHTLIVLPFVDQNRVKKVSAWINGYPVEVQTYKYPRNRALMCRWLDIIGTAIHPGTNDFVMHIDFE